ncbi:hypothetical protein IMCC3317_09200 [Kordia antarctica]|uniref:Uncharacterized protein n=1 Tax=Kordia antarctica TaxID=1218801 RepID=A0A7L4ZI23_9FLAO|nr:hypothetical protein [Kordia antarctica]QHI35574.1 hypothetical protein IMCC3317_09200 [Kordia antarctica]
MNKTIIAIYGTSGKGKSDTIKRTAQLLIDQNPNAKVHIQHDFTNDILLTIQIGTIRIGFESQGDPKSRIFKYNTLGQLADEKLNPKLGNCDIIICASRTRDTTVWKVDEIADEYDFHTVWISSFVSPNLNHQVLNNLAANNIINIINQLINEQL